MALGLLIIRLVIGLTMAAHGTQKLFGWFGGYGPKGTGGFFESIGIKPGVMMAVVAGLIELGGGLLFAAGLWTEVGAALIIITMIMAIIKVHGKNGYWVTSNGFEYNLALLVIALGVALIGAGDYSIDALM
ncbi:DoxX family protein [Paenibacillus sp. 2RAB27]|jgi:putative oxidoreductase|uniref:DoxX family membrane protein n=2 Tax=Paenibacillus TaxID=44249 RepID=A0ABX1XCN2_9BACL|nr:MULTISPECIES: DoxX family protein [Paenibacillus]KRE74714.1 oxidoreductase [Paenibacillus sp. Soil750]NOU65931.1 DoxX family membrane protein [Paenibacillus plantarum]CAH1214600.1 Putative oxidoreductase MhqP [Paenibacillus allorhizoplanae]